MTIVKKILGLIVLLVAGALGVGFATDPTVNERETMTIDAPVEKVFATVSNPTRVKDWLPPDIGKVEKVEVKTSVLERAAGALIDATVGERTGSGKNTPTHVVHFEGGKKLALQTSEVKRNEKYMERVLESDMGLEHAFEIPGVEWGFEMQKNAADPKKTDLTVVMTGRAKKPIGNAIHHITRWTGRTKKQNQVMLRMVESAAKQ